jgi:glycosyltransferase involved in cell wall biosynthesis
MADINKKIEILYVSNLCSQKLLDYLFQTSIIKPPQETQKFHRLLTQGLAKHIDNCTVSVISSIPVTYSSNKKLVWNHDAEEVEQVYFEYIKFINLPFVRSIIITINLFFSVFRWCLKNRKKNIVIISDMLFLSGSFSALIAAKLTKTKITAIVTDIPELMKPASSYAFSFKRFCFEKVIFLIMPRFNSYILFTEQMNIIVNPQSKPYIVIEGLVDNDMRKMSNDISDKEDVRVIMYAGGVFEKYGIKKLIEGFSKLEHTDVRLDIYGAGDMIDQIDEYSKKDKRVNYKGILHNRDIVQKEIQATLLVNPRFSTEKFSQYSFPSKNMEYMVSGTPIVTTKLPGMPQEYYPFVYLINNESEEGIYETLSFLLKKTNKEHNEFGLKSKEFVLQEKNNHKQALRLISFLNKTKLELN